MPGSEYSRDEFGMSLGYYQGDYIYTGSGGNSFHAALSNPYSLQPTRSLYNGNISSWVSNMNRVNPNKTDQSPPGTPGTVRKIEGHQYTYDRLNRLKTSNRSVFDTSPANAAAPWQSSLALQTSYSYDANGNLLTLQRRDTLGVELDNLKYDYASIGNKKSNRLAKVTDSEITAFADDIEGVNEYEYDAVGNLVKDKKEGIEVAWNVYGKVSEVKPLQGSAKPHITYLYDASGNRILKRVDKGSHEPDKVSTTYYIRDAQGNVLSIYGQENKALSGNMYQAEVKQSEVPIYGSDRVGMYNSDTLLFTSVFAKDNFGKVDFTKGRMGQKGENKHLLTAASKTETVSDEAGNSAAINSARLLPIEATNSGWQVDLSGGTGTQGVDFLGEMAGNVAVGETLEGIREVVALTATQYWGESNVSLLYDHTGTLLNNSEDVQADAKAKSIVVRNPGQSREYYLFTRNTSGQPLPQGTGFTDKASIEIGSDGNTIAFTQQSLATQAIWQTDLAGTLPVKKTDYSGDIRRSVDGNLYSMQPSAFDKWNTSGTVTTTSIALQTEGEVIAGLPQQVHVLQGEDLTPQAAGIAARTIGKKSYELKDHLGNVRVVVSDQKEARLENGSLIEQALVTGYNNYLPFGMMEPGGSYSASTYRYGFNGKELDKEGMGGGGSTYDYGFRIYNPNIAKFLSIDPLTISYPMLTPYQFASNTPIMAIDLDGLEAVITIKGTYWKNQIIQAVNDKDNARAAFLAFQAVTTTIDDVSDESKEYARKDWKGNSPAELLENTKNLNYLTVKNSNGDILFTIIKTPKEEHWYTPIVESISDFIDWQPQGSGYSFSSSGDITGEPIGYVRKGRSEGTIDIKPLMDAIGAGSLAAGTKRIDISKAKKLITKIIAHAQGAKQIIDAKETGGNIGDGLGIKGGEQTGDEDKVICPTCKQTNDSTHIDQVNGVGTFQELKKQ